MRIALSMVLLFAAGCASTPTFPRSKILHTRYDGNADDLLTAGLGKTGLGLATPPAVREPKSPTAAELRRRAIHANYRALADMSPAGGYGVLYGPNIDLAGKDTLGEGKIAGDEYLTYRRRRHADGAGPRHASTRRTPASSPRPRRARAASTARSAPRANGA